MTDKTVQVGERLAVSYDITNRGQSDGEQTVELRVGGEVVDSDALVLDVGSTDRMSLVTDAFTDEDDGQLYEVEIVTDDRVAQVMTVEVIAIPDEGLLLIDFDDDDLSEFAGDTDDFATTTELSQTGSRSLTTPDESQTPRIFSNTLLDDSSLEFKRGTVWEGYIAEDADSAGAMWIFGEDINNWYGFQFRIDGGQIRIEKMEDGSRETLETESFQSLNGNTFFKQIVTIPEKGEGDIEYELKDGETSLQKVSTPDDEFEINGMGYYALFDSDIPYWDDPRLVRLLD